MITRTEARIDSSKEKLRKKLNALGINLNDTTVHNFLNSSRTSVFAVEFIYAILKNHEKYKLKTLQDLIHYAWEEGQNTFVIQHQERILSELQGLKNPKREDYESIRSQVALHPEAEAGEIINTSEDDSLEEGEIVDNLSSTVDADVGPLFSSEEEMKDNEIAIDTTSTPEENDVIIDIMSNSTEAVALSFYEHCQRILFAANILTLDPKFVEFHTFGVNHPNAECLRHLILFLQKEHSEHPGLLTSDEFIAAFSGIKKMYECFDLLQTLGILNTTTQNMLQKCALKSFPYLQAILDRLAKVTFSNHPHFSNYDTKTKENCLWIIITLFEMTPEIPQNISSFLRILNTRQHVATIKFIRDSMRLLIKLEGLNNNTYHKLFNYVAHNEITLIGSIQSLQQIKILNLPTFLALLDCPSAIVEPLTNKIIFINSPNVANLKSYLNSLVLSRIIKGLHMDFQNMDAQLNQHVHDLIGAPERAIFKNYMFMLSYLTRILDILNNHDIDPASNIEDLSKNHQYAICIQTGIMVLINNQLLTQDALNELYTQPALASQKALAFAQQKQALTRQGLPIIPTLNVSLQQMQTQFLVQRAITIHQMRIQQMQTHMFFNNANASNVSAPQLAPQYFPNVRLG